MTVWRVVLIIWSVDLTIWRVKEFWRLDLTPKKSSIHPPEFKATLYIIKSPLHMTTSTLQSVEFTARIANPPSSGRIDFEYLSLFEMSVLLFLA